MLTEELASSSSEEKESVRTEKKGKGQEPTAKAPKKEQKGKQEKKAAEEKDDKSTLTPRKKRLQGRVDRTEQVHVTVGTSKAASPKSKRKTPSAKQAKTVPPISTGKPKTASTGS